MLTCQKIVALCISRSRTASGQGLVALLSTLLSALLWILPTASAQYDVLIRGGRIVDGSGAPWYQADVAISQGKIAAIGRIPPKSAAQVIEAEGLIVAPGFIDMMGQSATPLMYDAASARNLLTQGITTINCGEGSSAAPLGDAEGQRAGWTTMREYLALLDLRGLPVNVVQTIGHTQVRRLVLGDTDRRPSPDELAQMQALVREAMQAGAIGVSTALIYPPAIYASTQELAQLAKVAGQFGGRYYTHMRNEGDRLLEAIDEALEVGQQANTPVHIFHLKAAGRQNWGKLTQAIARITAARAAGQAVAADVYPYIHNGLGISALIHPRHSASGLAKLIERLDDVQLRTEIRQEMETTDGWENWFRHVGHDWNRIILGRTQAPGYRDLTGQSLQQIATQRHEDPWDSFFALVRSGAFVLPESMSEANKILAIEQPFISFCTDVGPASDDAIAGHPRAYGSFPRLLSRYVRELGVVSLERAINGASAVAANEIMAFDRGRIAVGLAADIIVFDYQAIRDQATFAQADALAEGMKHVLVAGVPVLSDGVLTSARPGRVLRGPGYQEFAYPQLSLTDAQSDSSSDSQSDAQTDWLPGTLPITGHSTATATQFDLILSQFVRQHHVPGMAVAVSYRPRGKSPQLILSKGYGVADLASGQPVSGTHLFRIASISKPITAVAILKLVEEGKFRLDDPILALLDYEAEIAGAPSFDKRWRQITVRDLLMHRGGWDRDQSFDAMFQAVRFARQAGVDAPAGTDVVIRAMLGQPLDFHPGQRYAYSNFGYCLLGRLIETATNLPYEQYVQQAILRPIGIESMCLGKSRLPERHSREVRYYQPGRGRSVFQSDLNQEVPLPYGHWHLEAMDSHGGWLASAEDLARFAMAFDDPEHCPLLQRATIEQMFARPAQPPAPSSDEEASFYYSLGWMNRVVSNGQVNHWHTGSLDGTSTILICRHDGFDMVALLNTRSSPIAPHLGREIDRTLHQAVNTLLILE